MPIFTANNLIVLEYVCQEPNIWMIK